jgi:hypothetical protein
VNGVFIFRTTSPAHTGELLFKTARCVRVLSRPDNRRRVSVQVKDCTKFNLDTNNLVERVSLNDKVAHAGAG